MLDRGSVTGRVALDGKVVHIHDVRKTRNMPGVRHKTLLDIAPPLAFRFCATMMS